MRGGSSFTRYKAFSLYTELFTHTKLFSHYTKFFHVIQSLFLNRGDRHILHSTSMCIAFLVPGNHLQSWYLFTCLSVWAWFVCIAFFFVFLWIRCRLACPKTVVVIRMKATAWQGDGWCVCVFLSVGRVSYIRMVVCLGGGAMPLCVAAERWCCRGLRE